MTDILLVLSGGGLAGIFFWAGSKRRPQPYVPPRAPEAICGCDHHYAYHDSETGKCNQVDGRYRKMRADGTQGGLADCMCKRYTGPEPLPEYI